MAGLTVEKVREVREKLKACEVKSYKGFIGLGPQGYFEIKNDEQLAKLKGLKPHSRKYMYRDCKKKVEL